MHHSTSRFCSAEGQTKVKEKHDEVCNDVKENTEESQIGDLQAAQLVEGINKTMSYRKYWKSVDKTVDKHVRSLNEDIHSPSYFYMVFVIGWECPHQFIPC